MHASGVLEGPQRAAQVQRHGQVARRGERPVRGDRSDQTCLNGHAPDGREVGEVAEVVAVAGVRAQLGREPGAGGPLRTLAAAADAGVVEGAGLGAGLLDGGGEVVEGGGQVAVLRAALGAAQEVGEAAAQREQDDPLVAVDLPGDLSGARGRGAEGGARHVVGSSPGARALLRRGVDKSFAPGLPSRPMPLPERPRAVVTGAGGGLGRALCLELARRRGRVLAADIDLAAAELTAAAVRDAGGEARAVACDVAQATQVEALVAEVEAAFGGADLVVNNAGVAASGPMAEIPLADWDWIVGINLMGVVHGCRAFIPHFKARGGGAILNVASAAGLLCTPEMAPYNATKAGVVALSETLCAELQAARISVTVLCPTFFQTNIMVATRTQNPGQRHLAEKLMARAKIQAPEVARHALASVAAGELYSLPHADGSWAWRLKRLAPERFYQRLVPRYFRRLTER